MQKKLHQLCTQLSGELHYDHLLRSLYATDASVYRELPLAVAYPKDASDIQKIIAFAKKEKTSIIPRTAGTSLAGQCVGSGIVVDVSKYMTKILAVNPQEKWVRVQPGVIRDELNHFLKDYGLFFGPNTSTANRCMIGGMVGNNSCGTTSITYGTTRDHVLELKTILSDGSKVIFESIDKNTFLQKTKGDLLENKVYQQIHETLSQKSVQQNIKAHFPKGEIHRRNTGYAIDELLKSNIFTDGKSDFNFCKLLTGSEGTLAFTTEIKLHLNDLPPPLEVVLCAHFTSINEAMKATLVAMKYQPTACELMDKTILDCTKDNRKQQKNRFFVQGDPAAILMIEFRAESKETCTEIATTLKADLQQQSLGYAFPIIAAPETKKVWELRKAGLGLLANIPGDKKAVACIEDTAVALPDLPAYIADFEEIMASFGQKAVYYAHAGAGEIHLRPILNLKNEKDRKLFREISTASAKLVKEYNGSLSGEHGDGRVRVEFLPMMIGPENYGLLRQIKQTWDADNIFNPGKITDAPPMDESLRYQSEQQTPQFETILDFSSTEGVLRAAEKCNGSGDCRKLPLSGGTMCPSYQATRNEKDTTRARANALREFLTQSSKNNRFDHKELYDVFDLCISCKGCTSECPSNVDMASLKAEFLHQYYKSNPIPLRTRLFSNISTINKWTNSFSALQNKVFSSFYIKKIMANVLQIAPERQLPLLYKTTLKKWFLKNKKSLKSNIPRKGKVFLFCDEFTNYYDVEIGIKSIQLLNKLGYEVDIPEHLESGRAAFSKGLLKKAQHYAQKNVALLQNIISAKTPLIGIEPSAILSFRDEYPRLVAVNEKENALKLAKNTFLIDEFLAQEIQKGNITADSFTKATKKILLHGHCHQKALSSVADTAWTLGVPENYDVEIIPSGCCGMAGSFGYEKEHYNVSMQIGELVLFPVVREAATDITIAAPGTSCRHQIADGTNKKAFHPVEILWDALSR